MVYRRTVRNRCSRTHWIWLTYSGREQHSKRPVRTTLDHRTIFKQPSDFPPPGSFVAEYERGRAQYEHSDAVRQTGVQVKMDAARWLARLQESYFFHMSTS